MAKDQWSECGSLWSECGWQGPSVVPSISAQWSKCGSLWSDCSAEPLQRIGPSLSRKWSDCSAEPFPRIGPSLVRSPCCALVRVDGLEILMVCPQSQETLPIIIYEGIIAFFIEYDGTDIRVVVRY